MEINYNKDSPGKKAVHKGVIKQKKSAVSALSTNAVLCYSHALQSTAPNCNSVTVLGSCSIYFIQLLLQSHQPSHNIFISMMELE